EIWPSREGLLYAHFTLLRRLDMKTCSLEFCDNTKSRRSGLCNSHEYHRLKGNPLRPIGKYVRNRHEVVGGKKLCQSCDEWLPVELYGKYRNNPGGLSYHCKDCTRWARIKSAYGITRTQYITLLKDQ